jgi:hypothetical protein
MGLSFVYAAGHRQRSLSRTRVSWDSRLYFTLSDLRFPFRRLLRLARVTVEVFDPASTRVVSLAKLPRRLSLYILVTDRKGNTSANSSSVFAWVTVAAGTCLLSCRLVTTTSCGSTIQAFQLPCHNILFSINANNYTCFECKNALSEWHLTKTRKNAISSQRLRTKLAVKQPTYIRF